jgi:hypothetical protein
MSVPLRLLEIEKQNSSFHDFISLRGIHGVHFSASTSQHTFMKHRVPYHHVHYAAVELPLNSLNRRVTLTHAPLEDNTPNKSKPKPKTVASWQIQPTNDKHLKSR